MGEEQIETNKESITSTDTDTPSGFEENDSEHDDVPPPPGFHRAPPSISGSSEASFNPSLTTGEKNFATNEDEENDDTFSHDEQNSIEQEKDLGEVELEKPIKKPAVKVPAQQHQQITHRKQKRGGGGRGRKRKGDNRNRSKSIDKVVSDNDSSSYSIISLAVKFCGMSIVIGLFALLYSIFVVVLL